MQEAEERWGGKECVWGQNRAVTGREKGGLGSGRGLFSSSGSRRIRTLASVLIFLDMSTLNSSGDVLGIGPTWHIWPAGTYHSEGNKLSFPLSANSPNRMEQIPNTTGLPHLLQPMIDVELFHCALIPMRLNHNHIPALFPVFYSKVHLSNRFLHTSLISPSGIQTLDHGMTIPSFSHSMIKIRCQGSYRF